jgi:hypothetical protein
MKEQTCRIKCYNCEATEFEAYEHDIGEHTFTRLKCVECGCDMAAGKVK